MKVNKKDYVVVNGKKYYAEGGSINEIDPKKALAFIRKLYVGNNKVNWNSGKAYTYPSVKKSPKSGMDLYNSYPQNIQEAIKKNRNMWADYLENWGDKDELKKRGIDIDAYRNSTNYDDNNSRLVNGYMASRFPNAIKGNDNGDNVSIPSGDNVFHALASTVGSYGSKIVPEDVEYLTAKGFGSYFDRNGNQFWSRQDGDDNSAYYHFYDIGNDKYNKREPITLIKDKDGQWHQYKYNYNDLTRRENEDLRSIDDLDYKEISKTEWGNGRRDRNGKFYITNGNTPTIGFKSNEDIDNYFINKNAYGGHLQRYYADGGPMGQIPLGEQMPEDYNMVGEGGMHEENPMGGVPYGMNQDGSQNMVEEGEVSVGDNVFSNRSQLSPELCEKLGMPQGTTPAEAMQQIEQLYEQGQISDEEFQEVQQIIFQDQEAQKENMGGSYQQGEVGGPGVPNEGIDPNMGGMPMDPMAMQGGLPEGITPDMIQGQGGFGGY